MLLRITYGLTLTTSFGFEAVRGIAIQDLATASRVASSAELLTAAVELVGSRGLDAPPRTSVKLGARRFLSVPLLLCMLRVPAVGVP